jgi:hypothetical protein
MPFFYVLVAARAMFLACVRVHLIAGNVLYKLFRMGSCIICSVEL